MSVNLHQPIDAAGGARSILYLDGIEVAFDGYKALRGLSLVLEPGEMRAIIGPNGAGKTTMMDVVTGRTRPDKGRAVFKDAHDLTRLGRDSDAEWPAQAGGQRVVHPGEIWSYAH